MYSETGTLVDDISKYYDNTDLSTVQDATLRQGKIMQFVNRVRDEIWWMRPWTWTQQEDTVTMSSGIGGLPADFGTIGPQCGLYDQANGRPWTQINFQEMQTLRKRHVRVNDRLVAIGVDGAGGPAALIPNTGSSEVFDLVYKARPLMLSYSDDILPMPTHFGQALLLGVVARLKEEEGDPRPLWREDYMRALSRAMVTEREAGSRPAQMPMAVGRKW